MLGLGVFSIPYPESSSYLAETHLHCPKTLVSCTPPGPTVSWDPAQFLVLLPFLHCAWGSPATPYWDKKVGVPLPPTATQGRYSAL